MPEIERKGGDRQISALARIKMERDEATQTDEGEGRAIPSNQRWYRYVFVRDNYPTWVQTSNWGGYFYYASSAFSSFGCFGCCWEGCIGDGAEIR